MQFISHKSDLLTLIYTVAIAATIVVICAPTDAPETSELEKPDAQAQQVAAASADSHQHHHLHFHSNNHNNFRATRELNYEDYYKFRNVVGDGVKKALDECRQKFKWDRWNCPLKSFQSIMNQDEDSNPMPSNKELGLTRALISSGIVLSIVRSCSVGTNSLCSCSNPITMPEKSAEIFLASGVVTNALTSEITMPAVSRDDQQSFATTNLLRSSSSSTFGDASNPSYDHHHHQSLSSGYRSIQMQPEEAVSLATVASSTVASNVQPNLRVSPTNLGFSNNNNNNNKFEWAGCDEVVKLGFRVAKAYLGHSANSADKCGEASQCINRHNFEAGRQAVRRTMKRRCKCQGTSGACQMRTCWTVLPDMSEIGDYLKRQYRVAAKVGASTAKETDAASLSQELGAIGTDKLVFADASPDYCYENKQLGINGTLGRYCSRTRHRNGTEVSRSERDSCDRLCTKCGYKIKREEISVNVSCDCRFKYCCSVECKRCPKVEETFKCVRHS